MNHNDWSSLPEEMLMPMKNKSEKNLSQELIDLNNEFANIIDDFGKPLFEVFNDRAYCFTSGTEDFKENEPWIQTYSGKRFTPLDPTIDSIVIQDIANALSMQCRFAGHISEFYSVAQHSVYVSYLCDFKDSLHGLLHDASEAYLVDIPSPLKRSPLFSEYRKVEENLQKNIYKRFEISEEEPESVKYADKLMLSIEAKQLLTLRDDWGTITDSVPPFLIKPLSPKEAKVLFLKRFFELMKFENYDEYLML